LLTEGQIYLALEKYKIASKNFNSLIINTDPVEQEYLAMKSHLGLARLHLATNKLEESVSNGEKALAMANKNNTEAKTADKIHVNNMNSEITRLEEKNEALSESANRSEITAILTSAFLTIISLLAISLYRNNQIKLKTNDLLQIKNTELKAARDAAIQAMAARGEPN